MKNIKFTSNFYLFLFVLISFFTVTINTLLKEQFIFSGFYFTLSFLSLAFFLFQIKKEIYLWNNGICRQTGKYWVIEEFEYFSFCNCLLSSQHDVKSDNSNLFNNKFLLELKFLNFNFDNEKAILKNKHINTINKINNF